MERKKDASADVEKKRALFLAGGFLVSLGIVLAALEWRLIEVTEKIDKSVDMNNLEEQMVQPSVPKKPKKQPKQTDKVEVVEEEEDIENELTISDMEIDEDAEISFDEKEGEKVKEEKVFMVVEDDPSFPGGEAKMMKYIQKHLKYPEMAKEMDVSGTVIVGFIVETDGSITNIQVLKGIGGGCDKEAKRVIKNMPEWKPGKQRGRAVRVNVKVPIRFRLN